MPIFVFTEREVLHSHSVQEDVAKPPKIAMLDLCAQRHLVSGSSVSSCYLTTVRLEERLLSILGVFTHGGAQRKGSLCPGVGVLHHLLPQTHFLALRVHFYAVFPSCSSAWQQEKRGPNKIYNAK